MDYGDGVSPGAAVVGPAWPGVLVVETVRPRRALSDGQL